VARAKGRCGPPLRRLKIVIRHSETYRMTVTILPEAPPTAPRRAPARRTVVIIAAVAVVVAALGAWFWLSDDPAPSRAPVASGGPSGAAEPQTARQWLSAALAAAKAEGSVHMDVVDVLKKRTLRYSDDDGPDRGIQRISVSPGMRAEVRVIGSQTYFTANRKAFQNYFGFPSRVAPLIAGHWLLLEPGMPMYKRVTEGVTFRSAMKEAALRGHLRLLPERTIDGVRVVGVRGRVGGPGFQDVASAHATLWVTAGTHPLPVRYEAQDKSIGRMVVTFTKWGANVDVTRPPNALPFTQLLAPSGSTSA
jgi:hypothetical protein